LGFVVLECFEGLIRFFSLKNNFKISALDEFSLDIHQLYVSHQVKTLYAFGSVLTENFKGVSDVDLVVDFENLHIQECADNYFDFKFSLQDLF
jgi:predicted nucleotidyltransferase